MSSVKQAVSSVLPSGVKPFLWYLTDRDYRHQIQENRRRIRQLRHAKNEVGRLLLEKQGGSVRQGPFAGMTYFERIRRTAPTPKLLGTYEKELWPTIEECCSTDYSTIMDVGADEGYYAIGMARRNEQSRIVAFEARDKLQSQIRSLAEMNGVADRISINPACDANALNKCISQPGRKLVICDIDGAEQSVLDPIAVPALKNVDILVEVHEHLCAGISHTLRERFQSSHQIAELPSVPRTLVDWPTTIRTDSELAIAAMDESRHPECKWFWMKTNQAESVATE